MSQEGYADPVMNDGPRFHSIIPVSELTERVTRVIKVTLSTLAISLFKTFHTSIHAFIPYAHAP